MSEIFIFLTHKACRCIFNSGYFAVFRSDLETGIYFHPTIYLLAVTSSIILYFVVALMDPGYVSLGDPDIKEVKL